MDLQIALLLAQDGIVNGAIYGLMALALVLVFSVTRVIFIPQGEFVAFGALSMAALQAGRVPATLWLLLALAGAGAAWSSCWRWQRGARGRLGLDAGLDAWLLPLRRRRAGARPAARVAGSARRLATLLVVVPLGPLLYRLAYRPLADATRADAADRLGGAARRAGRPRAAVLRRRGLAHAGRSRTRGFDLGGIAGQRAVAGGRRRHRRAGGRRCSLFFERSIVGKALRATAMNRVGARLMGIPTELSGDLSFALAALIGARLRAADRAAHHRLLRHRLPDRPEGLRRGHRRRPGELSAGAGRRAAGRPDSRPSPRSGPAPSRR